MASLILSQRMLPVDANELVHVIASELIIIMQKCPYNYCIRGHVNKKKFQKSKKTLEVGGWVKCPIGKKKNWKTYFYTLFYYIFGRAFERQQRYKWAAMTFFLLLCTGIRG